MSADHTSGDGRNLVLLQATVNGGWTSAMHTGDASTGGGVATAVEDAPAEDE